MQNLFEACQLASWFCRFVIDVFPMRLRTIHAMPYMQWNGQGFYVRQPSLIPTISPLSLELETLSFFQYSSWKKNSKACMSMGSNACIPADQDAEVSKQLRKVHLVLRSLEIWIKSECNSLIGKCQFCWNLSKSLDFWAQTTWSRFQWQKYLAFFAQTRNRNKNSSENSHSIWSFFDVSNNQNNGSHGET